MVGASVKGNVRDDLGKLVEDLGKEVSKTITERADELVAKPVSRDDRVAALKKKLGDGKRPSVLVEISEHHVGQALVERPSVVVVVGVARNTIDPAAETELTLFCTETGFKVIDPKEGRKKDADILISGRGLQRNRRAARQSRSRSRPASRSRPWTRPRARSWPSTGRRPWRST